MNPTPYNDIVEVIGNTPLVKLSRLPKKYGVKAQIYAKCEFLNPGGSVKDRVGRSMVEEAERSGRIKRGDVLIEPTSGNTGIGIALVSAVRGYKAVITLPEKMSQEKVGVLQALGAEVVRTPTEAAYDAPESHISQAKVIRDRINAESKARGSSRRADILDQYGNPANPGAHYQGTAGEIIKQLSNGTVTKQLDMFVATAGTGGTITGMARRLKESHPGMRTVGVDPVGSILAVPDTLNDVNRLKSYKVEGIGYDFIPDVLDRRCVDHWVKTSDEESFLMARDLIATEGLLVGGSSGSAMVGALRAVLTYEAGRYNREDAVVVVVLADSVRNYMAKFLRDKWMMDNGFASSFSIEQKRQAVRDSWRVENPVLTRLGESFYASHPALSSPRWVREDLLPSARNRRPNHLAFPAETTKVGEAVRGLGSTSEYVVVVTPSSSSPSEVLGVLNESQAFDQLAAGILTLDDPLTRCVFPKFRLVKAFEEDSPTRAQRAGLAWEVVRALESCAFVVLDCGKEGRLVLSHSELMRAVFGGKGKL